MFLEQLSVVPNLLNVSMVWPAKFFFKPHVTIPVSAVINGMIIHFMFHIRCISTRQLLYFILFAASFCVTFQSTGSSTSVCVFSIFLFLFILYVACLS